VEREQIDAGRKGTAAATDTGGKRTRKKGTATVRLQLRRFHSGLSASFCSLSQRSEVLVQGLVSKRGFFNDFLTRKKKFRAELSSPYQIKIDYRESIEFLSYVISYIIKSILRAEIIGEWPCRESKFVKFKQGAATRPYLYHHSTKLRVEAVLILLIPRVQIFPCLEQKLPAVRRPTIG